MAEAAPLRVHRLAAAHKITGIGYLVANRPSRAGVARRRAPSHRVARLDTVAELAVVATERQAWVASACTVTNLAAVADVAVGAGASRGFEGAGCAAAVTVQDIAIVAFFTCLQDAVSAHRDQITSVGHLVADGSDRAGVAGNHASSRRVARLDAVAELAVVTVKRTAARAASARAGVANRARIAIVARRDVGRVHASGGGVARVVRANVPIVAIERAASRAGSARAGVADRARITVIARRRVGCVHTSGSGVARVVGAEISVVTVERQAGVACTSAIAGFVAVAGIAVGARAPRSFEGAGRAAAVTVQEIAIVTVLADLQNAVSAHAWRGAVGIGGVIDEIAVVVQAGR